jgi:hypothetical protein
VFVMDKVLIRSETSADVSAIAEVTAAVDGRVVGHIAFSPVTISDGSQDWYGLGPVSVLPEEVFFALSLGGHIPQGVVESHEAFAATGT